MAVDDQCEISFSIPQGTLPWKPIFVVVLGVAVRRRLVAQPGGLTLGFALHLVFSAARRQKLVAALC